MPVPRGCCLRCAFTGSKRQAGQEIPKKGMVGPGMGTGQCCSLGHTCLQDVPAGCPAKLGHEGRLWNREINPQPSLLGHHWHIWRWAGPRCHCRHATGLAKTFLPPADSSPSPPGSGAALAPPAGGSNPKTCPATGCGSPHGCSTNILLTALTYQAGD